ncbi:MAG: glycosyltransferase [bacterium]|nr:glycosyltransferase [bacterium]MDO8742404.1 glycosyltransferase [bacterium]
MKVLFISNDSSIFDENSPTRARMHGYARVGELHVLSLAGWGAKKGQEGNLFLHPVHRIWKYFRVSMLAYRAHALIKKHGIEVVSAQDPFEHGLAALRAVRGTNAKLHIQVHTDFLSPWFTEGGNWRNPRASMLNRYRQKIADHVLPKAVGVRAVSERVKKSLVERYGSRIPEPSVIPIAVSTDVPACSPLPKHSFTFALIAVGRLEPEKRIEDILVAMKLISKKYSMVGLFVVGEGRERRKLLQIVRTLGLEKRVVFLGARPDAWGLMQSAQAFIQASAYEGYGRTLIEAALARVPIITTDVGIVGEVFKAREDVLVAPVADPKTLSASIASSIEDTFARQQLPMHAEATARAHLAAVGDLSTRIAEDLTRTFQHS